MVFSFDSLSENELQKNEAKSKMAFLFGRFKTIEDVTGLKPEINDIQRLRRAQTILLIDDQPFPYRDLLAMHSYQVDQVNDLDNTKMASSYSMILCDIQGVGRKLGGDSGGFLIKELRKSYPLKPILAYSGHDFDASYNRYFSLANAVLKKDISLEDWIETLDEITTKQTDPISIWKLAREKLLNQGVRIDRVMELESEYAKRIHDESSIKNWIGDTKPKLLTPEIKVVLESLIANLLTFYFLGGK